MDNIESNTENNTNDQIVIELGNRYRVKNKLVSNDGYKFYLEFGNDFEADYCRFGLKEGFTWDDNEYDFVDPSGGPFMRVGSQIDDYMIERITSEDKKIVLFLKKL